MGFVPSMWGRSNGVNEQDRRSTASWRKQQEDNQEKLRAAAISVLRSKNNLLKFKNS